jgi:hypothetical protein
VGLPSQNRVCEARFSKGQYLTDIRCELASIEQVGNGGQTCGGDHDEHEHTPDAVSHGLVLIRPGDRRHVHPSSFEHRERAVECLVTDRIDDDVDILRTLLEIGCLHVNDVVSTQGTAYSTSCVYAVAITSAPARFASWTA